MSKPKPCRVRIILSGQFIWLVIESSFVLVVFVLFLFVFFRGGIFFFFFFFGGGGLKLLSPLTFYLSVHFMVASIKPVSISNVNNKYKYFFFTKKTPIESDQGNQHGKINQQQKVSGKPDLPLNKIEKTSLQIKFSGKSYLT